MTNIAILFFNEFKDGYFFQFRILTYIVSLLPLNNRSLVCGIVLGVVELQ